MNTLQLVVISVLLATPFFAGATTTTTYTSSNSSSANGSYTSNGVEHVYKVPSTTAFTETWTLNVGAGKLQP